MPPIEYRRGQAKSHCWLLKWLLEPRHRLIPILVFLGALSTNLVIQKISDYYGYILTAIHYIVQILGENFEYAQLSVGVSLLAIARFRERRVRAMRQCQRFNQRARHPSAALAV